MPILSQCTNFVQHKCKQELGKCISMMLILSQCTNFVSYKHKWKFGYQATFMLLNLLSASRNRSEVFTLISYALIFIYNQTSNEVVVLREEEEQQLFDPTQPWDKKKSMAIFGTNAYGSITFTNENSGKQDITGDEMFRGELSQHR